MNDARGIPRESGTTSDSWILSERGTRHESDVLLRQIDSQLARCHAGHLPAGPAPDLDLAESIAAALRSLVAGTAQSSAADRARVRAAVHFFVVRRDVRQDRRPARPVTADIRVINEIMHDLGRDDLAIAAVEVAAPGLAGRADRHGREPVGAAVPQPA